MQDIKKVSCPSCGCSGVVGIFDTPEQLLLATREALQKGYPVWDTFTPYPVHGLDTVQKLRRSPLPFVTLTAGLVGGLCGFSFQYWTSVIDWPLNVGGKPFNSWPAFVPVLFECTVLFAGVTTVLALFLINRWPQRCSCVSQVSMTCDKFALWLGGKQEYPLDVEKEWAEFLETRGACRADPVHASETSFHSVGETCKK